MESLAEFADLPVNQFWFLLGAVFIAAIVRGFSGFALSALVMASVVVILPPVQLIPICFMIEGAASILMARGGVKDADWGVVWALVIGSAIGAPVGLSMTTTLPTETTKLIALLVILLLAVLLLARVRPKFVGTTPGAYGSGLFAGVITGLASVGGMVVAIFVLARDAQARSMRGSLVMYLALSMFVSAIYLVWFEMLDVTAAKRGLIASVPTLIGVFIGQQLFRPSLERFYRTFCLSLVILLAVAGLVRLMLA
ncbi:MAG: sulfite exporter TauE/SafE family protein [Pseudomonadota bacterium]